MRSALLLLLIVQCVTAAPVWQDTTATNIVPISRLADWTLYERTGPYAGPVDGRVVYTNLTGIDVTGATDQRATIQAAIDNCPANQAVVLPPSLGGYIRVDGSLYLGSSQSLRGSGMDVASGTVLRMDGGSISHVLDNSLFTIYTEQLCTNTTRGSTNVTMADTSSFAVGGLIYIAQFSSTNEYNNPLIVGVGGTNDQNGYLSWHVGKVRAKDAGSVTFWPPIPGNMTNIFVRCKASLASRGGVGVENMFLLGTNTQVVIVIGGAADCWVKGVRVKDADNYSIHVFESSMVEVSNCWFDDLDKGSGSNGAGVLINKSTGLAIFNNIIVNSFPAAELNAGTCGSVFSYNFLINTNGSLGIDSNHGPHNWFNLYEGNVTISEISDGYSGGESEKTSLREWINGIYTDGTTNALSFIATNSNQLWVTVSSLANPYGYELEDHTNKVLEVIVRGGSLPSGLVANTGYFMRTVNATNVTLHTSRQGAVDNTDVVTSANTGSGTIYIPSIRIGYTYTAKRFSRNFSIVGCVSGSGLPWKMTYDGFSFGQPNMGNSNYTGFAPPWADWMTAGAPEDFQELDTNVLETVIMKGNFDFYTLSVPSAQSLGSTNVPDSFYLSSKPSWFGNMTWPVLSSPNTNEFRTVTNYFKNPAQGAYYNSSNFLAWAGASSSFTPVTNAAPRLRGIRFR